MPITSLPMPVLVNGQRVTREVGQNHLLGLNQWELPDSDLLINFTNHIFYPDCGLCHKSCENQWGNNGYPLTKERICHVCNDRVVHNRIMMTIDTIGRNSGLESDEPDDPDN
jgi:hypothetical protein